MLFWILILCVAAFGSANTWHNYTIGLTLEEMHDSSAFKNTITDWTYNISADLTIDLLWLNVTGNGINLLTADNLDGVVSLLNCRQTLLTTTMLSRKGIPHVPRSNRTCKSIPYFFKDNTMYFEHMSHVATRLVQDMIHTNNWESVTLIFGRSTRNDLRNRLMFELSEDKILIHPVVIDKHGGDLRKFISNLPPYVVILAHYSEVRNLFTPEVCPSVFKFGATQPEAYSQRAFIKRRGTENSTSQGYFDGISEILRCFVNQPMPSSKIISIRYALAHSTEHIGHRIKRRHFQQKNQFATDDMGGRTLRAAVLQSSTTKGGDDTYDAFAKNLLSELAKILNFRVEYVEPEDGLYGAPTGNDSWNGMIGLVLNGEVDLAAAAFTATYQRAEVVDFTSPFLDQSVGIYTVAADNSPQLYQFLKPFPCRVWVIIGVFVLTTAACLWMVTFGAHSKETAGHVPNAADNWMLTISSLCSQGPAFYPSSLSARCLLGFWLIFSMIVVAMYTANLAAVLTVGKSAQINSLQDLAEQEDITVLVPFGSSIWTLFEDSKQVIDQKINTRKKAVQSIEDCITSANRGHNSVCIADRRMLSVNAVKSCGKTRVADESFFGGSLAFVLPKDSPYTKVFDAWILTLVSSGFSQRWERKWMNPLRNCSHADQQRSVKELTLANLGGLFIVYGIVVTFSFLVFFCEILLPNQTRCSPQKR